MKKLQVKLVRGLVGCTATQRKTLDAMGLRGLGSVKFVVDNNANRGQILKVQHMVKVVVE